MTEIEKLQKEIEELKNKIESIEKEFLIYKFETDKRLKKIKHLAIWK